MLNQVFLVWQTKVAKEMGYETRDEMEKAHVTLGSRFHGKFSLVFLFPYGLLVWTNFVQHFVFFGDAVLEMSS